MNSHMQSVLGYLGLLWLVAYFFGKDERDDTSRYHLKQGFGLLILGALCNSFALIAGLISINVAAILISVGFAFLIFSVLGIIHVINKVRKPLPLIGKLFENRFNFI
ncbi:hypothetical protein GCM10007415_33410 [Parapedobacter pyrenivorans]|uniref:Import component protein n=1 Tax=Parapedobacter pyrenivorans TaxID=1305674 RepID=A0A917HXC2_9SPHI|nr:hypothetical protein GCM10007415_33410 [Parapedobacter pyrenivorans]